MRPKYFSLIVTCLSVMAIGAMVWIELVYIDYRQNTERPAPIASLADISVPDDDELARMDRLERSLSLLATPPPQFRKTTDLSALGYRAVTPVTGAGSVEGVGPEGPPAHRLTLAFEGSAKRFCVIDSRLYSEGASLPDGATVVKIEARRVLIAKKNTRQWLVVDPFNKEEVQSQDS